MEAIFGNLYHEDLVVLQPAITDVISKIGGTIICDASRFFPLDSYKNLQNFTRFYI